jgi:ABC-type sugar transport system substrate-binding protein
VSLWFLSFLSFSKEPAPPHVIFINPGHQAINQTGPFWQNVSAFAQAAADDLNLDLSIRYAGRDHLLMAKLIEEAIAQKPEYLLLVNEKSVLEPLLSKADAAGIKTYLMLNGLSKRPEDTMYKHWLGALTPDNRLAGYRLASILIEQGLELKLDRKLKLFALLGDHSSHASLQRQKGLHDALRQQTDKVELLDEVVSHWSRPESYRKTFAYLSRFGPYDIIWAANDSMARGAIDAAIESDYILGNNVRIGGMNWDPQDTLKPEQHLSLGGHFSLGGFALVLLHEYHHGHLALKNNIVRDVFEHSGGQTAKKLKDLIKNKQLQNINFRRFSLAYQKEPLEMNLSNLLVALDSGH